MRKALRLLLGYVIVVTLSACATTHIVPGDNPGDPPKEVEAKSFGEGSTSITLPDGTVIATQTSSSNFTKWALVLAQAALAFVGGGEKGDTINVNDGGTVTMPPADAESDED